MGSLPLLNLFLLLQTGIAPLASLAETSAGVVTVCNLDAQSPSEAPCFVIPPDARERLDAIQQSLDTATSQVAFVDSATLTLTEPTQLQVDELSALVQVEEQLRGPRAPAEVEWLPDGTMRLRLDATYQVYLLGFRARPEAPESTQKGAPQ